MSFSFDLKEAKRAAALACGVVQAMFIQGCYSSRYDYYYGGNYYRYNYYYPCPFPRADYKNNMKIPDEDMRCDVCIAPNGAEYRMRCWYDYGAWEWVWAGIGIFLLVVLVGLLIWCCVASKKKQGEILDPNDPHAPLVVTSQTTGTATTQYTVAQLQADNARDAQRQAEINNRIANRQQAIDVLSAANQTVTAAAGQEVIVTGGEVVVQGVAPGPEPARRQPSKEGSKTDLAPAQGQPVAAASSDEAAAVPANDDVFSPSNDQKV